MLRQLQIAALSFALLAGASTVAHATNYNEGTQGDLSDLPGAPTTIGVLTASDNYIVGSTIPSGDPIPGGHGALTNQDNDFFTFTVAAGHQLSAFDIVGDTTINTGDRFFLGIYSGGTASVDPTNPTPAGLLGYTLPGTPQIGTDVLPDLAASDEAGFPPLPTHFSGALGAGTYTVWLVDGDSPVSYDLDLHVASVPEPATWSLMIGGVGLMGARLRRRSHRAIPGGAL
jgi:hypothetical protein